MAAVCHPAPLDDNPDQAGPVADKLVEAWAQLGFQHFREGIYYIDLARVTLDNALKQLRSRLASHF